MPGGCVLVDGLGAERRGDDVAEPSMGGVGIMAAVPTQRDGGRLEGER